MNVIIKTEFQKITDNILQTEKMSKGNKALVKAGHIREKQVKYKADALAKIVCIIKLRSACTLLDWYIR